MLRSKSMGKQSRDEWSGLLHRVSADVGGTCCTAPSTSPACTASSLRQIPLLRSGLHERAKQLCQCGCVSSENVPENGVTATSPMRGPLTDGGCVERARSWNATDGVESASKLQHNPHTWCLQLATQLKGLGIMARVVACLARPARCSAIYQLLHAGRTVCHVCYTEGCGLRPNACVACDPIESWAASAEITGTCRRITAHPR